MNRCVRSLAVVFSLVGVTAFAAGPQGTLAPAMAEGAAAARADIEKTFGFTPGFLKAFPDVAIESTWDEMKGLQMNPNTAIPVKYKELLGLALSSQIPCKYCVYAHTRFAQANGATEAETSEAVVVGAMTRHWSTFMNGIQLDEGKYKAELSRFLDGMAKAQTAKKEPPPPAKLTDAASAKREIEQSYGFVPEFLAQFPEPGLVGAWKMMRNVEMAPTSIPNKYKSLISLAVASQVPCRYCVVADTMFAKAEGATDAEVREAVAMGSFVRYMSTVLNGLQVDEPTFKRDVERLVKPAPKKVIRGASR